MKVSKGDILMIVICFVRDAPIYQTCKMCVCFRDPMHRKQVLGLSFFCGAALDIRTLTKMDESQLLPDD